MQAQRALLACPTGSIGVDSTEKQDFSELFPEELDERVYYLGFNSEDSFGANAYLASGSAGNLMFDSPRFVQRLVKRLEEVARLRDERFEWVLPGHGQRRRDSPELLQRELSELLFRMQRDEEDGAW